MEQWTIYNKVGDFEGIKSAFGVSDITARLLVNRSLTDLKEIEAYLHPSVEHIHSPWLLGGVKNAVELLSHKIADGKKIRVIGDYDVDGIMATHILHDGLRRAGADADWYIPHRIRDGYGINSQMIEQAFQDGIDTIITCDNGISAREASIRANELGVSLIVTDHHEIPEMLPNADVIVDPKLPDDSYPCREICGAVVAAKVVDALFEYLKIDGEITDYIEFMAMATICDVVELKGENRTICCLGLEKLRTEPSYGLASLIEINELDKKTLNEYHLGYILGPCFNATGRIDDASVGMDLLGAKTMDDAKKYALECKQLNEERKKITCEQEAVAIDIIEKSGNKDKVIVINLPDCHESILGIIAGRLKERYNKPTFAITKSGEYYKGSGRSIPAYNMFEKLKEVSSLLVKFGGHPMAAGLSIAEEALKEFTESLNSNCQLTADDMLRKIKIDAEVSFNMFDDKVLEELEMMAPFGQGNPTPVFAERNLAVKNLRYMGKDNNFLRLRLVNSCGCEISGVYFGDAASLVDEITAKYGKKNTEMAFAGGTNDVRLTVTYFPRANDYKDRHEIQMNIKAIKV